MNLCDKCGKPWKYMHVCRASHKPKGKNVGKLFEALTDLADARKERNAAAPPVMLSVEFLDGSTAEYGCASYADAWDTLQLVDPTGDMIVSAWRDGEPWFGRCTDMRPGVP